MGPFSIASPAECHRAAAPPAAGRPTRLRPARGWLSRAEPGNGPRVETGPKQGIHSPPPAPPVRDKVPSPLSNHISARSTGHSFTFASNSRDLFAACLSWSAVSQQFDLVRRAPRDHSYFIPTWALNTQQITNHTNSYFHHLHQ